MCLTNCRLKLFGGGPAHLTPGRLQELVRGQLGIQMSHATPLHRQIVVHYAPVELETLTVEPVLSLSACELPCLPQLRRQVKDQGEVGSKFLSSRLVGRSHQHGIKTSSCHLVGFGRKCESVGDHHPPVS